jgi:hypothetical protein
MSSVIINRFANAFLILYLKPTVELLISLIQEIWLAEPEGVHWNIRNPVYYGTMAQYGTMKTRWYDSEDTMVWT